MAIQEKSKEELIAELQQLRQENMSLKASIDKEAAEFHLEKDFLQTKMMNCDAVFESSPVAMFIIDETTNIVMVNLAAIKLCGGNEEEILQHRPGNALRCVHSAKDPRGCGYADDCKICKVRNAIEGLIEHGGSVNGAELELDLERNEKSEKVWMNVGVEPLMKDGQKLWCIAMNDITEQKKTEVRLKESQDQLKSIINSTSDMIWSVDTDTFGLLTYNQAFVDFFLKGLGIRIVKGMRPEEMLPTEDSVKYWYDIYHKGLNGLPFEVEYPMLTSNRTLKLSINPLFHDDVLAGLSVFAKDVTIQKQAETSLKESQATLKAITNNTPDLIWAVDIEDFKLINWNKAFEEYLKLTRGIQVKVGTYHSEIFPADSEYIEMWRDFYEKAKEHGSFTADYKLSDTNRELIITFNLLYREGKPFGISVFGKDITERKHAEEKIKRSELKYRYIFDNSLEGIYRTSINGKALMATTL